MASSIQPKDNLKQIMTHYFMDSHQQAMKNKFVVWIAIIVPIELLKGFDVLVVVPENHAATCAAKGVGAIQAEKAEKEGYSIDLCSYARIDLGTTFDKGKGSPTMGLPKPNLLISDNNNCSLLVKWFDVYHREYGVPHFILDVPFCYDLQQEKDLEYIIHQYKELIQWIEEQTNQKFNIEKVKEAVAYSNEANKEWKRFLSYAEHKPSGITAFETFLHMGPYIAYYRGTKALVDHFKLLTEDIQTRIKQKHYPVPDEKYRLLWDNIAPWHQLRKLSTELYQRKANIITATYTSCIGSLEGSIDYFKMDETHPLHSLARIQNFSVCPFGMELRFNMISNMIQRYQIDGVIFASNRSCKVYSVMQMDLMKRIKNELNIPAIMIDVDHADPRKYNESSVMLRIEALLELIDEQRLT